MYKLTDEVGGGVNPSAEEKSDSSVDHIDISTSLRFVHKIKNPTIQSIVYAIVEAVQTVANTIVGKTNTIVWTDIGTLLTQIGTGLISGIKGKTDSISWSDITGLVTQIGTGIISNINTASSQVKTYFDVNGDGKTTIDDLKGIFHIPAGKQARWLSMLSDPTGAVRTNIMRLVKEVLEKWMKRPE